MVTQKRCRQLVDVYQDHLGLEKWDIDVKFNDDDDSTYASVDIEVGYERAVLTLHPDAFEDENDAIRKIVHELIHIILSPFVSTMKGHFKSDKWSASFQHLEEQICTHIEKLEIWQDA